MSEKNGIRFEFLKSKQKLKSKNFVPKHSHVCVSDDVEAKL